MSTRSTTHFVQNERTVAIVYRHSDGYPEGHGRELGEFFADVEAQTEDRRFTDPSYLAAKLVVWLADRFAVNYVPNEQGEYGYVKAEKLDFLSVGVVMEDPGDIEYRYEVDCSQIEDGRPVVRCYAIDGMWSTTPTRTLVPIPEQVAS